jgi:hypothetical protein
LAGFVRPGAHNLLGDLVTARELQPVLFEVKKILADTGRGSVLGLAGAVRCMGAAFFDFLDKGKRHPTASLSQFDAEARDDSVPQPLRIALVRGSAEFQDTIGDHFADMVGVLRAVQHDENCVKRVAQKFGAEIIENDADSHGATRAVHHFDPTRQNLSMGHATQLMEKFQRSEAVDGTETRTVNVG